MINLKAVLSSLAETKIPLNFETDLDHHLDTKIIKDPYFSHLRLFCAMAEVCTLQMLLLYNKTFFALIFIFIEKVRIEGVGNNSHNNNQFCCTYTLTMSMNKLGLLHSWLDI